MASEADRWSNIMSLMALNRLWVSACQRRNAIPGAEAGAATPWSRPEHTHIHKQEDYHWNFRIWQDKTSGRKKMFLYPLDPQHFSADLSLIELFPWNCLKNKPDLFWAWLRLRTNGGCLPLRSVCGCWWWRPGPQMKPRGAPPQPTWPSQAALPALAPWASHSSTNHLWQETQDGFISI